MLAKKIAAEKAVELIRDNMTIGLGSGSTAAYAIQKIGERVQEGLRIKAVASSLKSETLAKSLLIPVVDPAEIHKIDMSIDGADEVDTKGNVIKGGGGSLLREKIIAFASELFYVIIDDSKLVTRLGTAPLPVEIVTFGSTLTIRHLRSLGCDPVVRKHQGASFITDNGNLIVDCQFHGIDDPAWLDVRLKMIPGVIETGLFSSKILTALFVGSPDGSIREISINP
jgi:ribose 5-phosphate isomerase A